jgi:hypothetical protein
MHDVADRGDSRNERWIKEQNRRRFMWQNKAKLDRLVKRSPAAVLIITYVVEKFRANLGYAKFSHRVAARELEIPERTAIRALGLLRRRCWLHRLDGPPLATACYTLGDGPVEVAASASLARRIVTPATAPLLTPMTAQSSYRSPYINSESERSPSQKGRVYREEKIRKEGRISESRLHSANGSGAKPKPVQTPQPEAVNGHAVASVPAVTVKGKAPARIKPAVLAMDSAKPNSEVRFEAFRELASRGMPSEPALQHWHLLGCAAAVGFAGADLADLHRKLTAHFAAADAAWVARWCRGEAA